MRRITSSIGVAGFTLVELVLVLALLGIFALAAIVFSPDVRPARIDAASRQIQSDIEFAKENAMTTGVPSGVVFTSGGSYTAYQGSVATPLTSPLMQQPMIVTLSSQYAGVSLSTSYTVEFNRFGFPTTGGGGSVTITDGTNSQTISVEANTGRVSVP